METEDEMEELIARLDEMFHGGQEKKKQMRRQKRVERQKQDNRKMYTPYIYLCRHYKNYRTKMRHWR